jgi:hypothetical protein
MEKIAFSFVLFLFWIFRNQLLLYYTDCYAFDNYLINLMVEW